jgi:hypothetical protein
MLVFVTTPGHSYSVKSLVEQTFGAETPACQVTTYYALIGDAKTVRATHIFTDIERLYDWELSLAAHLYRSLREAGISCLNDPARVMCRYELLRTLHAQAINPFNVYRAEDRPKPARFPVFLRREYDHRGVLTDLIPNQAILDAALRRAPEVGLPLRGVIVVEFASEPVAPGVWQKFNTFRVGNAVQVNHAVWQDRWCVKDGTYGLAAEEMLVDERDAVFSNRFAEQLRPIFEIGRLEWGRADHATFEGREIVYEANTNPQIYPLKPQRSPIRDESFLYARQRMAKHLWAIDSGDATPISFRLSQSLVNYNRWGFRP